MNTLPTAITAVLVVILLSGCTAHMSSNNAENTDRNIAQGFESRFASLEAELRQLKDLEEIRLLRLQYHEAINEDRIDDLADLFTGDAVIDFGYLGRFQGSDEIRNFFTSAHQQFQFVKQFIHNHQLSVDGDRAAGSSYLEARSVVDDVAYNAAGRYIDEYIRTGDGWRFQEMRLILYYTLPYDQGWAQEDLLQMEGGLYKSGDSKPVPEPTLKSMNEGELTMHTPAPRITPLGEEEWTDDQREILAPIQATGQHYNIVGTLARNWQTFLNFFPWANYIVGDTTTLDQRDREILILRTGWLCKSDYEWQQHLVFARRAGLTEEEIDDIKQGPDAKGWGRLDSVLLRAADELHTTTVISDSTWQELSSHYRTEQLMDIVYTVGQYQLIAMLSNSFGVELDEKVRAGWPE